MNVALAMVDNNHRSLQTLTGIIGICAGALVIGAACLFGFWLYLDTQPPFTNQIVYTMDRFGNKTDHFRAGDTMLVYRDLCFTRDLPVTFGRSLRRLDPKPELNVTINQTTGQLRRGCVANANTLVIPAETLPGRYRFENVVRWANNPFTEQVAMLPPVEIVVLP